MKSNIVAILLTFSLCPISIMGQGFSNFVGNKDRILTTDTVCNGRNKLVVDEVLTPVEEGRYKHTMRIFINDKNGIREKCKVFTTARMCRRPLRILWSAVRKERWYGFAKQYKADGCDATVCFCLTSTSTATSTSCSRRRITPRLPASWLNG